MDRRRRPGRRAADRMEWAADAADTVATLAELGVLFLRLLSLPFRAVAALLRMIAD
ncbi:hypothetical protein [Rhodococcus aetherivorans]|uniref:hypothetical protein n=1 Tax=Rhodococcus aetherivorans TaxID=191292 RepID=UPI001E5B41CE|nr:hypothetical protein [Rhodococcus aetherivorans]UGQ42987.1 hypothetical protein LRQ66_06715 [Rhodococcus aetherivorans]